MIKFTIPGALIDLNKYIAIERGNLYAAANLKKHYTEVAYLCALSIPKCKLITPVKIIITWCCGNKRKDPDNIAFAKKFILDGLVQAGILKDDNWKRVSGFEDIFVFDLKNPRIEIAILNHDEMNDV